jgi:hypothetical protein
MFKRFALALFASVMVAVSAPDRAATRSLGVRNPQSAYVDVSANGVLGNRFADCRLTGHITLWVRRELVVLDDMQLDVGTIDAGLAQFGKGSKLQGCIPDGRAIDLSGRFADVLIADDRPTQHGVFTREEAAALASQLAQDFYRLVEVEGSVVPLVDAPTLAAIGSASYRFTIVLIRDGKSGAIDAIVQRQTVRTKFASRLTDEDRRLTTLRWSSVR